MKKRKKILFILPALKRAGAENQLIDLANKISTEKFEKYLFTFEKNLDQLERVDRRDIRFYNQPRQYKFDFSMVRSIAKIINDEGIDLVHCTLPIALLMGWAGVRLSRNKPAIVFALHTTINKNKKDDWLDYLLYQWLMRGCKKVICVCKNQQRHWQKKFPFLKGKSEVVYNGIDPVFFDPEQALDRGIELRKSLGISKDARVACCIARFQPEKGHLILLDAFRQVLSQLQDVYLILAGDGILRAELESRVQELGMADNVRFLGSVGDVRPVLAASDISVIASTAVETFSIAMLESMSMKVPVVGTDIGGMSEAVIHGVTGFVVPVGDENALAQNMLLALSNNEMRRSMGVEARKLVERSFTRDVMIEQTEQVIERII